MSSKISDKSPNGLENFETTYLDLVQNELLLKKRQLFLLISHPLLKGHYVEEILRDSIKKFIPKKYSVASGFIASAGINSKQLDIIIYDNTKAYPIFLTENIVIIQPIDAKIVIEVKTNKNSGNVKDAIALLENSVNLCKPYQSLTNSELKTMIVFFNSPGKLDDLIKKCEKHGISVYCMSDQDDNIIKGQFEQMLANIRSILINATDGER